MPTWVGTAALAAYAVVAWVYLLSFPEDPLLPGLDQAWSAIVTRAGAEHWAFGREIMLNYGPWAHLGTGFYYAPLFMTAYFFQLASKLVLVALICRVGRALPAAMRWPFFAANLVIGILEWEYTQTLAIVYAGWLTSEDRTRTGRVIGGAGIVLAAASGLMKTFYLGFGQGVFACVLARHVLRGRGRWSAWLDGIWPLALFETGFGVSWLLAGQHFSDLPAYLRGTLALTDGQSRAMGLDPSPAVFWLSLAIFVWTAGLGVMWFRRGPRGERLGALPLAAVFAGGLFMAWKQGLTRADCFHASGYFCFVAVFITAVPLFFDRRAHLPRWHAASVTGVWLLAAAAMGIARPAEETLLVQELISRPVRNLGILFAPAAERARLDALVEEVRARHALPQTRAVVGRARIDGFGTIQGLLVLNDLNYAPVPTLQGYLAYPPYLSALDARCYAPGRAPEFVLFEVKPIDGRWESLDGAVQLREILWNYEPILVEKNAFLLRRKPEALCSSPQPVLQQQGEIGFDTPLPLPPDGADWCELEVHRTLFGRLLSFLYHESALTLETTMSNGNTRFTSLPPIMAQGGFLLRQPARTADDLECLFAGTPVQYTVTSIRLGGDGMMRASVGETITYRFYRLDPPRFATDWPSVPLWGPLREPRL